MACKTGMHGSMGWGAGPDFPLAGHILFILSSPPGVSGWAGTVWNCSHVSFGLAHIPHCSDQEALMAYMNRVFFSGEYPDFRPMTV